MAINSKAKGKAGELELSKILREHGYDTRRGQQYCGANGDADVVGLPYVHIECKRVEKLNLDAAMDQARGDSRDAEKPCVIHRKNREQWKVTMLLDDWIELYREWAAGKDLEEG
jgi:Holliday junction resolvase